MASSALPEFGTLPELRAARARCGSGPAPDIGVLSSPASVPGDGQRPGRRIYRGVWDDLFPERLSPPGISPLPDSITQLLADAPTSSTVDVHSTRAESRLSQAAPTRSSRNARCGCSPPGSAYHPASRGRGVRLRRWRDT